MATTTTTRASWPLRSVDAHDSDDDLTLADQRTAQDVIGDLAMLLRDTRGNMLVAGCVLGASTIGFALEAAFSARVLRPDATGVLNVCLLGVLLACWLMAVTLLALAGRPVLHPLSEIRWGTGAPVDPRARWLTLPPIGTNAEEWTWTRAHLMVGAARLARYRSQRADTWAYITAAAFVVWTAAILLGL